MVMTPSFPYMVMFQLVKKEQEYQDLEGKHTQTMFDYQAKVSKFEEEKKQLVIEVRVLDVYVLRDLTSLYNSCRIQIYFRF